jgi:hypothetical protein
MTKKLSPQRQKDIETGRQIERAYVIKYLKDTQAEFEKHIKATPPEKIYDMLEFKSHRRSCALAANAIKNEDHIYD